MPGWTLPGDNTFRRLHYPTIDGENAAFLGRTPWPYVYRLYTNLGGSLQEVYDGYTGLTDQSLSGNTIVFTDTDNTAIYRADLINPPPHQERLEVNLPEPIAERNLVLITHGWNRTGDDTFDWVDVMESTIEDRIDLNEWAVVPLKWDATGTPWNALQKGAELGRQLGDILANLDFDHVHLIAHSAGSALIDEIATKLVSADNPPSGIHATFLDAFAPPESNDYGEWSDDSPSYWADHYFNSGDVLPIYTDEILDHAYNINVTNLNPAPPDPVTGHEWPRVFYQQTILDIAPDSEGTGFPYSYEAGNRDATVFQNGQERVLGEGEPPTPLFAGVQWTDELFLETIQDVGGYVASGLIDLLDNQLTMETESPAWFTAPLIFQQPTDLLRFDLQFTSDLGAEGLFAVYFDDQVLGTIDERYAPDGMQRYVFQLPDTTPGRHTLSFRLDPFTETASRLLVTNVELGLLTLIGDMDGDGDINFNDIDDFVLGLNDPLAYEDRFGVQPDVTGDMDGDGDIDFDDISGFVNLLNAGGVSSVPEPSGLPLFGLGLVCLYFLAQRSSSTSHVCYRTKHGHSATWQKTALRCGQCCNCHLPRNRLRYSPSIRHRIWQSPLLVHTASRADYSVLHHHALGRCPRLVQNCRNTISA